MLSDKKGGVPIILTIPVHEGQLFLAASLFQLANFTKYHKC